MYMDNVLDLCGADCFNNLSKFHRDTFMNFAVSLRAQLEKFEITDVFIDKVKSFSSLLDTKWAEDSNTPNPVWASYSWDALDIDIDGGTLEW